MMDLNQIILIEERSELNQLLTDLPPQRKSEPVNTLIQEASSNNKTQTYRQLVQTRKFFIIAAFFLGLLLSITTTKYAGKNPINIFYYLIVFVIIPLISFFISRSKSLTSFFHHDKSKASILPDILKNYHKNSLCLAGCVLTFTGALCLVLIGFFTDLHFSWSTTYVLQSSQIYAFLSVLEIPWKFLTGSQWLQQALVESSQYNHLLKKFAGEIQQSDQGIWVGFLTSTTLAYSVLPRLLYFILGEYSLRKITHAYKLSTAKKVYFQNTLDPQKNHGNSVKLQSIQIKDLVKPYFLYYTDEDFSAWIKSHDIQAVSKNDSLITVVVVDAFESPDKSFRKYLETQGVTKEVDLAVLPLQKTNNQITGPTKNQHAVWSTLSLHRETIFVETPS